jgi:hypothetical protein
MNILDVPASTHPALIIVKRRFYDAFASGEKTTELRRHRPPFTERVFYPGRLVRVAYNYNIARNPSLLGWVRSFDVHLAENYPELRELYPELRDDDEIAAISIALDL